MAKPMPVKPGARLFIATLLCTIYCSVSATGAAVHIRQTAFIAGQDGTPPGWTTWAARPEIAPRTFVDSVHHRSGQGSLAISGASNASEYGGWEFQVSGVNPGKWYRFTAYYRAEGVEYESQRVVSRLDWGAANGRRAGQPDYPYQVSPAGDWKEVTLDAPAPPDATTVKLQLYLANSPQGTVYWDDIAFDEIPDPAPRPVTIATINLYPRETGSPEASVRAFLENIEQSIQQPTDVILLGEAINVVGSGKHMAEAAEPIPGATTARLAEVARRRKTYLVSGMIEREGHTVYNAAVVFDRGGNLIGKYRKVYLPREEIEAGVTPGNAYPVFQTDFGRVGVMICWDVQYTDPARALALQGAEIILMPIWAGSELLEKARAYENHLFLVTSSYDEHTEIIDPNGEVVVKSPQLGTPAITTIDLNRRYVDPWLGDMRGRLVKEIRLHVGNLGQTPDCTPELRQWK